MSKKPKPSADPKPCDFCVEVFEDLNAAMIDAQGPDAIPHYLTAVTIWLVKESLAQAPGQAEAFFSVLTKSFKIAGLDVHIARVH